MKEHRIYEDEEQSREEETEESDEESDASSRDVVYYAIPASELFKTRTGLLVKPVLLYKNELLPLLKHPIDNRHGKLYSRFKQDDIPRRGRYLERPRDNKFFAPDFPRREKFYGKGYRLDY